MLLIVPREIGSKNNMASVFARPLLAVSPNFFLRRAVSLKRYKLQQSPRYMSTISSKIQVNGVEIHYEVAGQSNHVVLCLPGALGSTQSDFGPQLKELEDEFTVIAFDPRGYGKSIPPKRDFPANYFVRDANDATALMKTLGKGKMARSFLPSVLIKLTLIRDIFTFS